MKIKSIVAYNILFDFFSLKEIQSLITELELQISKKKINLMNENLIPFKQELSNVKLINNNVLSTTSQQIIFIIYKINGFGKIVQIINFLKNTILLKTNILEKKRSNCSIVEIKNNIKINLSIDEYLKQLTNTIFSKIKEI